ncbi:MAG: YitT family protein [Clostridia bacterium]|nr:YitT family protein [Clostridia bacterium]
MKRKIVDFLMITLGTLLVTGGVYFFKFPNNFSTGGVSGISIILGRLFSSVSPGTYILVINISLLIIGFLFVGKEFGAKTVYCSLLMSLGTRLLEIICPMDTPFTNQPLLELIFAIFLPGIGSAILFNCGASTGGTDIVAMIIKKIFKTNISKALFIADFIIVMMTFFVFGIETWLFCVLGVAAKMFVMNDVIESLNSSKYLTIITKKGYEVQQYIINEIHKGATVSNSFHGGFSNEEKSVVLTALTRRQALLVKNYAKKIDPQAFIVISTTSDIIGKGFRECV